MPQETVTVWAWLFPWWQFWHWITKALWWPAWSTLFSAGALTATIYLANSNARQSRRKDAAFIIGAAAILDTAVHGARLCLAENRLKEDWEARLTRTSLYLERLNCVKMIEGVDLTKFPEPASLQAFLSAKIDVGAIVDVAKGDAIDRSDAFLLGRVHAAESQIRTMLAEARKLGNHKNSAQIYTHMSTPTPDGDPTVSRRSGSRRR